MFMVFHFFIETSNHYAAPADLELTTFLHQPPRTGMTGTTFGQSPLDILRLTEKSRHIPLWRKVF